MFELAIKIYIASNIPLELKARAYSLRYAGVNGGAIVGPVLGAWFILHGSDWMFFYTAVVSGAVCLIYWRFLTYHPLNPPTLEPKARLIDLVKVIANNHALLYLSLAFFIYNFAYAYIDSVLPMVMRQRITDYKLVYASLLSVNALTVFLLSLAISFVIDKLELFKMSNYSTFLMVAAFVCFAVAKSALGFYLAIILLSLGEVLYASGINLHIDRLADNKNPGLFFGVGNVALIGAFCGPVVGSSLFRYTNGFFAFIFAAALVGFSLFLFRLVRQMTLVTPPR